MRDNVTIRVTRDGNSTSQHHVAQALAWARRRGHTQNDRVPETFFYLYNKMSYIELYDRLRNVFAGRE